MQEQVQVKAKEGLESVAKKTLDDQYLKPDYRKRKELEWAGEMFWE